MGKYWKQIKLHTMELLGLDLMNSKFKVLAVNYVFLMIYYTLESVFVNTLLYRVSPQLGIILQYRAVVFLMSGLSMNVAAYISKVYSPVTVIKLGGFAYIVMYVLLFFGMDYMGQIMYLVAFCSGCGMGFYWSGHNVLLTLYTERANRAVGISIMGLLASIMMLFVPIVSGFVIQLMPGHTGYRVMFGVGMLAVILQRRMQGKLSPVTGKKKGSDLRLAFKLIAHKSTLKLVMAFEFLRGMRDGALSFMLNMLLFALLTDESLVGFNTFLTGIISIIGSWAYGKLAGPGKRIMLSMVATTILLLSVIALFLKANVQTLMIFTALNAFFVLFLQYTGSTFCFDVMAQNETTRQCLAELSALREIALSGGRLAGLAVVAVFSGTINGCILAMIILTVIQYPVVALMKLTRDTMDRKNIKRLSAQ